VKNTFADRVITFNKSLIYSGKLPPGFDVLNPFNDNPETTIVMQQFYKEFYNDNKKRKFIIGINPSRHGAGVTGVPFTDTKRLESVCKIKMQSAHTHEGGMRSGTLNVPGIVGLGEACHIAEKEMWDNGILLSSLRTRLEQQLESDGSVMINGSIKNRLNNTSNLTFKAIKSEDLIKEIRPVAVAAGSACTAALPQPSHVLLAMGLTEKEAYNSVRFSLGKYTTAHEIDLTIEKIRKIISSKI